MTPRQRLLAALTGRPVDRAPIWTVIPFEVTPEGFEPGPFHGYADYDPWRKADPAYQRLVRRMQEQCDNCFMWRPPCMLSEPFLIPQDLVRSTVAESDGRVVTTRTLRAGGRELRQVSAVQPGTGHTWTLEHYCKSAEDAALLLELPWNGPPATADGFARLDALLGDRGVMFPTIPSPLLIVCRLFDPQEFLILARTESALIHRLMETAAARVEVNLRALLAAGIGPVVRFGGAEHATPPLMGPADFDDLVVRYDGPLVNIIRQAGRMATVHCHGRIRHALLRFVEMGMSATDPVETIPDGDFTLEEARQIAGDRLTLMGNLQMREMELLAPEAIRQRVRGIIAAAGPQRLILMTTGTPLEAISPALAANYHAMIDAAMEQDKA